MISTCKILFFLSIFHFSYAQKNDADNFIKLNNSYKHQLKNNFVPVLNEESAFGFVFKCLENEIVIGNSENYYYFEILINGRHFKGNFGLFRNEIENGKLSFNCKEVVSIEEEFYKPIEFNKLFSSKDSLAFVIKDPFSFLIKYKNKSVSFSITKTLIEEQFKVLLPKNDFNFLGKCFDDSGLNFSLFQNKVNNQFMFVLDEDNAQVENFLKLSDNIFIGLRTGFAFYIHPETKSKVLFGVNKNNEYENNNCDGPFDQLPDNYLYVNKINLGFLISKLDMTQKELLDQYGNYTSESDSRYSITPYYTYNNIEDLMLYYFSSLKSSKSEIELIDKLTKQM